MNLWITFNFICATRSCIMLVHSKSLHVIGIGRWCNYHATVLDSPAYVARSIQLKLVHSCSKQEAAREASLAKLVEHQLRAPVDAKQLATRTRQNAAFTTLIRVERWTIHKAKSVEPQLRASVDAKRLATCTMQNATFTSLHSRRAMNNSQIKVLIRKVLTV